MCAPATVSTARGTHSAVQSVLPMSRRTTATSAPRVSHSTTEAAVIAIVPGPTSGLANVVGHARYDRNAAVPHSAALSFTSARTGAAARPRFSQHTGVRQGTAAEKESRGAVRRTEESDWVAPLVGVG